MAELVVQLAEHDKVVRGEREHWFSKQGFGQYAGFTIWSWSGSTRQNPSGERGACYLR